MSKRDIRSYDYVNRPYAKVRDALKEHAVEIFHQATSAASSRAENVAAALHVKLGELEIGADIAIEVIRTEERHAGEPDASTVLELSWVAAQSPRLFPLMHAELTVYALTSRETQLDFFGHYDPPLGVIGGAIDAVVGHRIAEASVHRFLKDVARYMREHLEE